MAIQEHVPLFLGFRIFAEAVHMQNFARYCQALSFVLATFVINLWPCLVRDRPDLYRGSPEGSPRHSNNIMALWPAAVKMCHINYTLA